VADNAAFLVERYFTLFRARLSTPTRHVSSAIEDDTMGVVFGGQHERESVSVSVALCAMPHACMAEGNTKINLTSTQWCAAFSARAF
jgi:hypothetical protein